MDRGLQLRQAKLLLLSERFLHVKESESLAFGLQDDILGLENVDRVEMVLLCLFRIDDSWRTLNDVEGRFERLSLLVLTGCQSLLR